MSSLVAQMVKNLPAIWEAWVGSQCWEDALEKGMAIHSSITWRIPWTEEPGRSLPWGRKESGITERLSFIHLLIQEAGESCL